MKRLGAILMLILIATFFVANVCGWAQLPYSQMTSLGAWDYLAVALTIQLFFILPAMLSVASAVLLFSLVRIGVGVLILSMTSNT